MTRIYPETPFFLLALRLLWLRYAAKARATQEQPRRQDRHRLGLGGGLEFLLKTVFNYPTLAECYKIAALDAFNKMSD